MNRLSLMLSALLLAACGGGTAQSESANPSAAPSPKASAPAGAAGKDLEGIVLRYAPGGARPDRFCEPQWSIANQTGSDIPGMLIEIAWQGTDGTVLEAVGEYGRLFENLKAGQHRDRSLNGHAITCQNLKIVVGRYACRDDNAVRMPCPGPLHVLAEGGIQIERSDLSEGPMRGAIEP